MIVPTSDVPAQVPQAIIFVLQSYYVFGIVEKKKQQHIPHPFLIEKRLNQTKKVEPTQIEITTKTGE